MTSEVSGGPEDPAARRRRRFAGLLLAGVAGAGAVLLATRQEAAHVVVTAPRPLPRTVTSVSWQDLLPVVAALAVAALASMAAVLATRGWLRRVTGLTAVALGACIAGLAAGPVTRAAVLAAAGPANLSPASGAGGGIAPGSTTAGGAGGTGVSGSLAGFPAHVELAGSGWRVLIIAGAVLIVVVGVVIVLAAAKLPAMSGRYERSGQGIALAAKTAGAATPRRPASASAAGRRSEEPARASAPASLWESLTAGADPTAQPGDEAD
jgi:Tryptophan-associated transmembrane protein (Trp_oprn_chp)